VECFLDCFDKNNNPVDINYILHLKMDLKTTVNSLKQGYEITSGGYINNLNDLKMLKLQNNINKNY